MGRWPEGPEGPAPSPGFAGYFPASGEAFFTHNKKRARACARALSGFRTLSYADALGARALGARLDFELNLLATLEAVEVAFGATAVEEVFLSVLGLDKSKATIRNQFFDSASRHSYLLSLERRGLLN